MADQGPGIPPEDRERVFEAFYRGRTNPETPGSGSGLAIAKAIVMAHGGTHLDRGRARRRRRRSWWRTARKRTGRGGVSLVLVVDDEPQIRRALRTSLEAHG